MSSTITLGSFLGIVMSWTFEKHLLLSLYLNRTQYRDQQVLGIPAQLAYLHHSFCIYDSRNIMEEVPEGL